jgi:sulfur carrier protein
VIVVNGKPRALPPERSVQALLMELDLDRDGIAVAVDRKIVPRSAHPTHLLEEGAVVEIIRAVGGG